MKLCRSLAKSRATIGPMRARDPAAQELGGGRIFRTMSSKIQSDSHMEHVPTTNAAAKVAESSEATGGQP